MENKNLAFSKINFILLAIGFVIVVIGFILMAGGQSTEQAFDPTIFSAQRIKVAPIVCLTGFLFMIVAILYHKKDRTEEKDNDTDHKD